MMPSAVLSRRIGSLLAGSSSPVSSTISSSSTRFYRPQHTPQELLLCYRPSNINNVGRQNQRIGLFQCRRSIIHFSGKNISIQSSGGLHFPSSSSAASKPKSLVPPSPTPQVVSSAGTVPSNLRGDAHSQPVRLSSSSNLSLASSVIDTTNAQESNAHQTKINGAGDAKIIRIKRRVSSQQHDNNANELKKQKGYNMNGYKYRLLTTPQLTNEMITLPEKQHSAEESSNPQITSKNTTLSSQIIEKENHDIQQLQQQYTSDEKLFREGKSSTFSRFPRGIKDVLSSQWWRSLYQNIGNTNQTTTNTSKPSFPNNNNAFQTSSMRNRRSSSILLEEIMNNNESYTGFLPDERHNLEEGDENISERVRVRSVQAASSIDVVAVLSKVFGGGVASSQQYTKEHPLSDFFAKSPPIRHVFGRTNIIIQLAPPSSTNCPLSLSHTVPRYVAIYRFGSVVFFNLSTKESSRLLEQIKKHSVDPIAVGFERREHFVVAIQANLETTTGKIAADRATVRELDMNTVGIVSNIMGQTVALDWHNDTVDELLAKFSSVNSSVERTGSFVSEGSFSLFFVSFVMTMSRNLYPHSFSPSL